MIFRNQNKNLTFNYKMFLIFRELCNEYKPYKIIINNIIYQYI